MIGFYEWNAYTKVSNIYWTHKIFQQPTHTLSKCKHAREQFRHVFEADTWIRSINWNWPQNVTAPLCYWLLFFNQLYSRTKENGYNVHNKRVKKWVGIKHLPFWWRKVPGRKCFFVWVNELRSNGFDSR